MLEQIAPCPCEPLEFVGLEDLPRNDEHVVLVQQRHEYLSDLFRGHRSQVEAFDSGPEVGPGLGGGHLGHAFLTVCSVVFDQCPTNRSLEAVGGRSHCLCLLRP